MKIIVFWLPKMYNIPTFCYQFICYGNILTYSFIRKRDLLKQRTPINFIPNCHRDISILQKLLHGSCVIHLNTFRRAKRCFTFLMHFFRKTYASPTYYYVYIFFHFVQHTFIHIFIYKVITINKSYVFTFYIL